MSDLKDCSFDKVNKCQGKNSGGHAGTIRSVPGGLCAKLTKNEGGNEVKFYQKHQENGFKDLNNFIPKFGGFCIDPETDKKYISVENIKVEYIGTFLNTIKRRAIYMSNHTFMYPDKIISYHDGIVDVKNRENHVHLDEYVIID